MKKNIVITFRTDEQVKKLLDQMAEEKEWSVSQVVEKICKEYFKERLNKAKKHPKGCFLSDCQESGFRGRRFIKMGCTKASPE